MTTVTIQPLTARPRLSGARSTFPRIIASELVKAKAIPSTWITAGFTILFAWGLTFILTLSFSIGRDVGDGQIGDMVGSVMAIVLGTVPIAAGCLLSSIEYGTNWIRSTLAAVPRRQVWLGAKTLAAIIVVGLTSLVTILSSVLVAMLVIGLRGGSINLTAVEWQSLALFIPVGVIFGLIGFGLGVVTRSMAAGITIGFVLDLVLPLAFQMFSLQVPWIANLIPFLPIVAGQTMASINPGFTGPFWQSQGGGAVTCLIWVVLCMGTASLMLQRRDA